MLTRQRPGGLALLILGTAGWVAFAYLTVYTLAVGWQLTVGGVRQVDWHVFSAGARALLDGRLYGVPLDSGGLVLSSPEFNHPPLAAAWVIPLLPFPVTVGGTVWQAVAAISIGFAAAAAAAIAGLRRWWLWAGIGLGLLSFTVVYLEGLHLATNNYLELGLVAGFAWLAVRRQERGAGILLGLAIAAKGWPLALAIVVIRERRWRLLAWAAGVVAIQGVIFAIWLGANVPFQIIDAMRLQIPPTGILFGPTAIDWLRPIWNSGLSLAVAVLLLAIPARGRVGIGLGILAGLAPIANLWIHYAPTVLFALVLIVADLPMRPVTRSLASMASRTRRARFRASTSPMAGAERSTNGS